MDAEDPSRSPSDPVDAPAPWAPLVEEPPGDSSAPWAPLVEEPPGDSQAEFGQVREIDPARIPAPDEVAGSGRRQVPPPPPAPPRALTPSSGQPFPPGMVPNLRAALGPAPIGANGFPIYGPGSIPSVARRGWAQVMDTLLVALVWLVFIAVTWANVGADGKVTIGTVPFWAIAASRGLDVLYQALAIGFTGRTLGKWIMGLKVEGPNGHRPGFHGATLRILVPNAISLVPVVGPAIAIVLYLVGGTHMPLGRTFYDRGAGTLVVSAR